MNLTSRSRYALKIMMDLAFHHREPHVHRKDIAARQGVPTDYLDQIMISLRRAELVMSVRGRGGGYRLARPAEDINLWQLFRAVESAIEPVQCLGMESSCGFDTNCASHEAWRQIFTAMRIPLEGMSLKDITNRSMQDRHLQLMDGVRECRGASTRSVSNTNFAIEGA